MKALAVVMVLAVSVAGQTGKHATKKNSTLTATRSSPSVPHISDAFAKAGLKALKAIEGEVGTFDVRDGSFYVPKRTQELIDDADIEARTDAEKKSSRSSISFLQAN